ncbi:MAG: glycosyltransferase, partial [Gammaproteobacteria bacterium]|nr:glycosyltransferase [Gemmatimonadota bacterium]NIU79863.1 glycosyltransferase [Gammaproteobacteria bacterium]
AVAVAHNYLFEHPELRKAADRPGGRLLRLYTRGTTLRTRARVALSFVPMSDDLRARLHVAPPL